MDRRSSEISNLEKNNRDRIVPSRRTFRFTARTRSRKENRAKIPFVVRRADESVSINHEVHRVLERTFIATKARTIDRTRRTRHSSFERGESFELANTGRTVAAGQYSIRRTGCAAKPWRLAFTRENVPTGSLRTPLKRISSRSSIVATISKRGGWGDNAGLPDSRTRLKFTAQSMILSRDN